MIIGIDPSQRHTGLCLLTKAGPVFHEIKTEDADVLTSAAILRKGLREFISGNNAATAAFALEKQLSVGGQSSSLQFHFQMMVLEVIKQASSNPTLIMPMPIQLQSYVRKQHGCTNPKGRTLVQHFQRTTGHNRRISEHCVDAFYLAKLGQDVLAGVWRYKLPEREAPLIPWRIRNGD